MAQGSISPSRCIRSICYLVRYLALIPTRFDAATNLIFANQNISIAPNTIKLTVEVENWGFTNVKHQLNVVTKVDIDGDPCRNYELSAYAPDLQWLSMNAQDLVSITIPGT